MRRSTEVVGLSHTCVQVCPPSTLRSTSAVWPGNSVVVGVEADLGRVCPDRLTAGRHQRGVLAVARPEVVAVHDGEAAACRRSVAPVRRLGELPAAAAGSVVDASSRPAAWSVPVNASVVPGELEA